MDVWDTRREWRTARRLTAGYSALLTILWFALAFLGSAWTLAYLALLAGSALMAVGLARAHGPLVTAGALVLAATVGVGLVSPLVGWRILPFPILLLVLAAFLEVGDPARAALRASTRARLK